VGKNDKRVKINVKEKLSHYRLGSPFGLQEFEALRIARQSALEGNKVVSPTVRVARRYRWYSFLLEVESTPGPY